VLDIPVVHACIITFHVQSRFWLHCINNKVVITVRAILVTVGENISPSLFSLSMVDFLPVFELCGILSETFLALLACENLLRDQTTRLTRSKNRGVPSLRSSGACAIRSLGGIGHNQTISGLKKFSQSPKVRSKFDSSVQQCERMATWAFRMCLLQGGVIILARCRANFVLERLRISQYARQKYARTYHMVNMKD
jgi:hypothetical protein